jgi:acetylglutamate kinase
MTPVVFKLGGEALTNQSALAEVLTQIKEIQQLRHVVIVHGGGPQVEQLMTTANLETVKVNGLRATPDEQLPLVTGALAGIASQQLLSACKKAKVNAVSLSLSDAELFTAKIKATELGNVGEVQANDATAIETLLNANFVVLLNSIGCTDRGQTLNINADDAAVAAAQLLDAQLCLLSNVPGVLDQDNNLISSLTHDSIESFIRQGVIRDGMAVKVNAALDAARHLRRPVNIGSWQDSKALSELNQSTTISLGTQIQA